MKLWLVNNYKYVIEQNTFFKEMYNIKNGNTKKYLNHKSDYRWISDGN